MTKEYPGKPFFFLDPATSFDAGSKGLTARRLQGPFGARLGAESWKLGFKAYDLMRGDSDRVSPEDFAESADSVKQLMMEVFDILAQRERSGSLKAINEQGESIKVPLINDDTSLLWQITSFLSLLEGLPAFPENDFFLVPLVLGCLLALDEAVGWSINDDTETCSDALLDAARLMHAFELIEGHETRVNSRLIVLEKERASARGRLRHAKDPKRPAKDFVRECWEQWRRQPALYATATAFARDMLEKQPLLTSDTVVTRWVRDWIKEADQLSE